MYRAASWNRALRRLVVVGDTGKGERVFILDLAGQGQAVRLPLRRGCSGSEQTAADSLPDGRIVIIDKCLGPLAITEPDRAVTLDVYDPRTGRSSRYRPYCLFIWQGAIAFSPRSGVAGLYAKSDGLAGELERLGSQRRVPIHLPVSNVGSPSWASDGRRYAIDGIPLGAGPDTPTRTGTPWRLYVVDSATQRVRALAPVLESNAPSTWSPSGAWIAFRGAPRGRPEGLWAIEVETGKVVLLLRGTGLGAPTWLPDGRLAVPASEPRSGLLVVGARLLRRVGLR